MGITDQSLSTDRERAFNDLTSEVAQCEICPRMAHVSRVLGLSNGPIGAALMFVGEAPGRLGADQSQVPFHGDKAGHNFERLLAHVGLDRYQTFITNAVLCNPRDTRGNNAPPALSELRACSSFLRRQVDLVDPQIVVPLGGKALQALGYIEEHGLALKTHVRTMHVWYGRLLIPAYHPGQRAMIHRSFANQLSDYQFIVEKLKRRNKGNPKRNKGIDADSLAIVDLITYLRPKLSYFSLHKLFYLIELESIKSIGARLTNAYIIRQKDGPYCTDFHATTLKKAFPDIKIVGHGINLLIIREEPQFFSQTNEKVRKLPEEAKNIATKIVDKYGNYSNEKLKTAVYLSKPMRDILKKEKNEGVNMYNFPLLKT